MSLDYLTNPFDGKTNEERTKALNGLTTIIELSKAFDFYKSAKWFI